MAEQVTGRRSTRKSPGDEKQFVGKKKAQAELDQEAYLARQYAIVIGELKAAEARNRIRATRLRCSKSHRNELDQIIAFQPNALTALRFEAFMTDPSSSLQKPKHSSSSSSTNISSRPTSASTKGLTKDPLTQIQRRRIQNLILDDENLLVNRTD